MVKIFLAAFLLLAVVSARNIGLLNQNGNGQGPQSGNFGSQQGINNFGWGVPGGQEEPEFLGHDGEHGFPGHQDPAGHDNILPPFLSNVTQEALEELQIILENEELTKAEVENQVLAWAKAQGDEVAQNFEEMQEELKEMEEKMKRKVGEIIKNATELIEKIAVVTGNMEITMAEEEEQIKALFVDQAWSVIETVMMLEEAAKMETMGVSDAPGLPRKLSEGATEIPVFNSGLRGF